MTYVEDPAKDSILRLKFAGFRGTATKNGYIFNYKGQKYNVKDLNNLPKELLNFKKDILKAFGGKTNGGINNVINIDNENKKEEYYHKGTINKPSINKLINKL